LKNKRVWRTIILAHNHNLKVGGSNPSPATNFLDQISPVFAGLFCWTDAF